MKKHPLQMVFICSMLLMASCSKQDHSGHPFDHKKHLLVKELDHGTRRYTFHYGPGGQVDSIAVTDVHGLDYVYRVARHGKKIDSVSLVQNGAIVSTNGDIIYDHRGRITGYTYYLRAIFTPYPAVITLTYGPDNNIATIKRSSGGATAQDTLVFDQHHDLVRWYQHWTGTGFAAFTYDNRLNPLYFVNDLFVVFVEEIFFWEYLFSKHNSTAKGGQYPLVTPTVSYTNEYDPFNRLQKKIIAPAAGGMDSLVFRYNY